MPAGAIREIILVGAGKVASQLGIAFARHGLRITAVYNRTPSKGMRLAKRLGTVYFDDPGKLDRDADLYLVAVSDTAVRDVALRLHPRSGIVAHTSGNLEREVLEGVAKKNGIFYPLQTFAGRNRINFHQLPVCIEGSSSDVNRRLTVLADALGARVLYPDHRQRQILHLGAVIASNFSNYLYAAAEGLLVKNGLDFDVLRPLIRQTALNASRTDIFRYQTGPAVRGDHTVIDRHTRLLKDDPELLRLYQTLTDTIIKHARGYGKL